MGKGQLDMLCQAQEILFSDLEHAGRLTDVLLLGGSDGGGRVFCM